jgi:transcriptional regulator with XRE-family HTH domain
MDLKQVFIVNLKNFRKIEGFSQMKLAEKCNTDVSYIGQIEIGRRFPSIELIEKIALALEVEPYRLFMNEPGKAYGTMDQTTEFLTHIPCDVRRGIIDRLSTALSVCVKETLTP